jgi:hypothetical protein
VDECDGTFQTKGNSREHFYEMLRGKSLDECIPILLNWFCVPEEVREIFATPMMEDVAKNAMIAGLMKLSSGNVTLAEESIRNDMDEQFFKAVEFNNITAALTLMQHGHIDEAMKSIKAIQYNKKILNNNPTDIDYEDLLDSDDPLVMQRKAEKAVAELLQNLMKPPSED